MGLRVHGNNTIAAAARPRLVIRADVGKGGSEHDAVLRRRWSLHALDIPVRDGPGSGADACLEIGGIGIITPNPHILVKILDHHVGARFKNRATEPAVRLR